MYEVFEQLLQKYGVTPYKVAKEAGVTQTALSNWKSGRSTPSSKTLQKVADYFGVTVDYLMTGRSEIPKFTNMIDETETGKPKGSFDTMRQLKKEFNLDKFDYNLVHEYLKLDGKQRKVVRDFFYRIIDAEESVGYISEVPKTPEELEKEFPPIKENSKETG